MLKILRTTLRQPCGLAKRKMVLRLPQEIPQKCVRRQVHGCRRADVKRALNIVIVSVNHFKKETYSRNTIENKDNFFPVDFYGTNG